MSKKKSLGSSPIGYSSEGIDSFDFIPSIAVSSSEPSHEEAHNLWNGNETDRTSDTKGVTKQIASYSLEEDTINRVKALADKQKSYYSTVVGHALEHWLELNGF